MKNYYSFLNWKIFSILAGLVGLIFIGVLTRGLFLKPSNSIASSNCTQFSGNEQSSCRLRNVKITMQAKGIDAALDEVGQIASTDKSFLSLCHSFTHEVGQAAYVDFAAKKDFQVSAKVTMCSYGFYHGFMEALLQRTGNYDQAREFCGYIDSELKTEGLDLTAECYHGIGHGVAGAEDTQKKGNASLLTQQALAICQKVTEDSTHQQECSSGVFNGIANGYNEGIYTLADDAQPLALCQQQIELFKAPCYGFMARVLLRLANQDLSVAVNEVSSITETQYQKDIVANLSNIYASTINQENFPKLIQSCQNLVVKWQQICLAGSAIGLLQSGSPGQEYEKPFAFCQSKRLDAKAQANCIGALMPDLYKLYGTKGIARVCAILSDPYNSQCQSYVKTDNSSI